MGKYLPALMRNSYVDIAPTPILQKRIIIKGEARAYQSNDVDAGAMFRQCGKR